MAGDDAPWRPASLRDREDLDDFVYLVVEEEIDGTMGLVAAAWPAGGHGAPRFQERSELELAIDREELQRQVAERRLPEQAEVPEATADDLRGRRISVGDVFAIKPTEDVDLEGDPEPLQGCGWMGETLDITADAREAAKVKMYEALTPPLDPRLAERLLSDEAEPGEPVA